MPYYRNRIFIWLYLFFPDTFSSVSSHWFWLLVPPSGWTVSGFFVFFFLKRGQRRGLPSFPISSRAGPDCHKGSGHAILNARGRWGRLSSAIHLYHRARIHMYACQSVQNYFQGPVIDVFLIVEELLDWRAVHSHLAALSTLSARLSGLHLRGRGRSGSEWYTRRREGGWEGAAIGCQEEDEARGEVIHIETPSSAVHYSALAPDFREPGWGMRPYEKWPPLRAWPLLISAVDLLHLISVTPASPLSRRCYASTFSALRAHTRTNMRSRRPSGPFPHLP